MEVLLIIFVGFILFDLAAWRWGVDTTDVYNDANHFDVEGGALWADW